MAKLKTYFKSDIIFVIRPKSVQKNKLFKNEIIFDEIFFNSRGSYSSLLLSKQFYKCFLDFDYILIYQLDCLIFSHDLEKWTNKGYDYIGAPFFKDIRNPLKGFSRVGNGGFSLRNVKSFLKVLKSKKLPNYRMLYNSTLPDIKYYNILKKYRVIKEARFGIKWYCENYSLNEDLFWSDRAKLFYPNFKVAPIEIGLKFSFEAHPRYSYELNNKKLPFGAHAWEKWDLKFWKDFRDKKYDSKN